MTEAIFLEKKILKIRSFLINFILVYGFFFLNIGPSIPENSILKNIDLFLSVLFGVPLIYQFLTIFQSTYLKISTAEISENMTFNQFSLKKEQIIGYRFIKLLFTNYLVIDLLEPEKYISNLPYWKKILCLYNLKQVKSPIKIPLNQLNSSMHLIYEELKRIQGL